MERSRFVILGGGMVAGYAAKQLVELGMKPGELAILSSDDALPYERPPLSKGFLAGKDTEDAIRINAHDFYVEHRIEVKLRCDVTGIAPQRKNLILKSGGEFGYDKLVLATGARPRVLDVEGAGLRNVLYLRSLDDSKLIRSAAENVKRAMVIGGGFIGMEVAAVLSQKGIDITMVLSDDRIWKKLFSPQMSKFFEDYYAGRGIKFAKNAKVTALKGDGVVKSVTLGNGQSVATDMVVAGIGVLPVTDIIGKSGIEVENGVVVNEYLETSVPDIYAAGDVANYQDVLFGKRRRVEHWDNAVSQGQHSARILMGDRSPFRHVPYFFSDVFDLSYEYWGDTSGADQVIHRGVLSGGNSFSVWWLRQGQLVAAFAMNRPDEERELAPKWIEEKQKLSGKKLEDASKPIATAME